MPICWQTNKKDITAQSLWWKVVICSYRLSPICTSREQRIAAHLSGEEWPWICIGGPRGLTPLGQVSENRNNPNLWFLGSLRFFGAHIWLLYIVQGVWFDMCIFWAKYVHTWKIFCEDNDKYQMCSKLHTMIGMIMLRKLTSTFIDIWEKGPWKAGNAFFCESPGQFCFWKIIGLKQSPQLKFYTFW